MQSLRARIITTLILVAFSAWQLYARGLDLGLDLRGGTHLILAGNDPASPLGQREEEAEGARRVILERAREMGAEEPAVQTLGDGRLLVELAGGPEAVRARQVVSREGRLQFTFVKTEAELDQALPGIDR